MYICSIPDTNELSQFIVSGIKRAPAVSDDSEEAKAKCNPRWDHANINQYYGVTRDLLYPTYNSMLDKSNNERC